MSVQTIRAYVVRCDGCSRELSHSNGYHQTFDTTIEALTAARTAGWTVHPNRDMCCPEGDHQ